MASPKYRWLGGILAVLGLVVPVGLLWLQSHRTTPGVSAPCNPYKTYNELTELGEMVARGNDDAAKLLFLALQKSGELKLRQSWLAFHGPRSKYWPFVLEYAEILRRYRQVQAARQQFQRAAQLAEQAGEKEYQRFLQCARPRSYCHE